MKIVLAHPGQQHSFHVAQALKENKQLDKYITSIYCKKTSVAPKLIKLFFGEKAGKSFEKRRTEGVDDNDVLTYYELLSLVVIVTSRHKKTKKLSYKIDTFISDRFGIRVAKYAIKHNADAVICFSTNERTCFQYLEKHAPHIKRIVDCANSPINYMKDIYDRDIKDYGSVELKTEAPRFWQEYDQKEEQIRFALTQYFLAPSQFVRDGLMYCGIDQSKILLLPYGSNFEVAKENKTIPDIVRFIYVGQVTYRKGAHHLLKAFSMLRNVEYHLDVVGGWKQDSSIYNMYKDMDRVTFHGHVEHYAVKELLKKADVFVFSSLSEGLSLSCIEALSCGLPVICTTHSGANDLISEGINGFVYEPSDINTLIQHIKYFIENKNLIPKFSKEALQTATRYTWDVYAQKLNELLSCIGTD